MPRLVLDVQTSALLALMFHCKVNMTIVLQSCVAHK